MQDQAGGEYRLAKEGVEFSRYLREEGWHIIPIRAADQLVIFHHPKRSSSHGQALHEEGRDVISITATVVWLMRPPHVCNAPSLNSTHNALYAARMLVGSSSTRTSECCIAC